MKNLFIELTDQDDHKILINVMHIAWVEAGKNGTTLKSNLVNYSFPTKVKESYDEVRSKIAALDN
jgi:hypothetical protein